MLQRDFQTFRSEESADSVEALVGEIRQLRGEVELASRKRNGSGDGNGRTWQTMMLVLQALLIPWMVALTLAVGQLREDVAVIKGNRFTSTDGIELQGVVAGLQQDVLRFQLQLTGHEERLDVLERER